MLVIPFPQTTETEMGHPTYQTQLRQSNLIRTTQNISLFPHITVTTVLFFKTKEPLLIHLQ